MLARRGQSTRPLRPRDNRPGPASPLPAPTRAANGAGHARRTSQSALSTARVASQPRCLSPRTRIVDEPVESPHHLWRIDVLVIRKLRGAMAQLGVGVDLEVSARQDPIGEACESRMIQQPADCRRCSVRGGQPSHPWFLPASGSQCADRPSGGSQRSGRRRRADGWASMTVCGDRHGPRGCSAPRS